ncbi:MAG: hypothetical protein R2911_22465 [Caldilineaceae bacterium]
MEILGGPLFGVAGAGESHGPAITTLVFGCPPGLFVTGRRAVLFGPAAAGQQSSWHAAQ